MNEASDTLPELPERVLPEHIVTMAHQLASAAYEEGCAYTDSMEAEADRFNKKCERLIAAIRRYSEALARAAVPAVQPQEPVAWMQIGAGPIHEGERFPRLTKPKEWNPEWWRFEPLYAAPHAEARQEQPKQPDSSYSAQPKGDAATERDAALTLDQKYWLDRRADIIEALRREGLEIWSDKDRVWLHHIKAPTVAALSSTPAQGDDGGGVQPSDGAQHWPVLYAILRPAITNGNEAVRQHAERLAEVLEGHQRAALRELLDRPAVTEAPARVVHGNAGVAGTQTTEEKRNG